MNRRPPFLQWLVMLACLLPAAAVSGQNPGGGMSGMTGMPGMPAGKSDPHMAMTALAAPQRELRPAAQHLCDHFAGAECAEQHQQGCAARRNQCEAEHD